MDWYGSNGQYDSIWYVAIKRPGCFVEASSRIFIGWQHWEQLICASFQVIWRRRSESR
jgi:hypothetical protein